MESTLVFLSVTFSFDILKLLETNDFVVGHFWEIEPLLTSIVFQSKLIGFAKLPDVVLFNWNDIFSVETIATAKTQRVVV